MITLRYIIKHINWQRQLKYVHENLVFLLRLIEKNKILK